MLTLPKPLRILIADLTETMLTLPKPPAFLSQYLLTNLIPVAQNSTVCAVSSCVSGNTYIFHTLFTYRQEKHIKRLIQQHLPDLCKIKSENPN